MSAVRFLRQACGGVAVAASGAAPSLADRFAGCLLGQAVGDAVAAPFESIDSYSIYRDFGGAAAIIRNPPQAELCYTDDTEMMIGVAECLLRHGAIEPDHLANIFCRNFDRTRGYGPGTATILVGMQQGHRWQDLVQNGHPGGSYGNGAAMRAAPGGLIFRDLNQVAAEAAASALVTHAHPLGVDGAVILASAVALVLQAESFDFGDLCRTLAGRAGTEEFRWQLEAAAQLTSTSSIPFGSGIEAHRSVVSAICCFGLETSFERAITRALALGGDVDTLASMAGALAGTRFGVGAIPDRLLSRLENGTRGRDYLFKLATELANLAER